MFSKSTLFFVGSIVFGIVSDVLIGIHRQDAIEKSVAEEVAKQVANQVPKLPG